MITTGNKYLSKSTLPLPQPRFRVNDDAQIQELPQDFQPFKILNYYAYFQQCPWNHYRYEVFKLYNNRMTFIL
jgi:hypothetical protein